MANDAHGHADGEVHAHVLPVGLLAKVLGTLILLTGLTVWTGTRDLHGLDLAIALLIATTKASLVCLFFMHLKYDKPFHGMIFLFSVMFVGLFLAFVSLDKAEYEEDIRDRVEQQNLQMEEAGG